MRWTPRRRPVGYHGKVSLVSPRGDQAIILTVPGWWWDSDGSGLVCHDLTRDRRFRRLLSRGWRVAGNGDTPRPPKPEEKPKTGGKPSGDGSVNGENEKKAEGEKKEAQGQQKKQREKRSTPRGKRGRHRMRGERGNGNRARGRSATPTLTVQKCTKTGGAVRAPQPLQVTAELLKSAEASAELLAELVGRAAIKVRRSVTVDTEALLIALETGDNPLPPLEAPDERPKARILVTPDCSGSTQNWNGLGQAWSLHLSKAPGVEVTFFENFNGALEIGNDPKVPELWDGDKEQARREWLGEFDVVVYLGDGDGGGLCEEYAKEGLTVLALDTHCARVGNPRLRDEEIGQGHLYWVDRVSAKAPETWAQAIGLCLKQKSG